MSVAEASQLHQWAERILFSPGLDAKLAPPPAAFRDDVSGPPLQAIPLPARPDGLALDDARPRPPFPGRKALEAPQVRGQVLHFFANHELLALELMALVLLRFPDAPRPFRRGLANTMRDEQRHLALYLDRMATFGVKPGDVPVNDFFWRTLSTVANPMQFVAGMSLTFEQANLDFALYYRDLFNKIGDTETGALMQAVFVDEIGHVRHGLRWLRRWKAPEEDEWAAHLRNLRWPMTPARARGRGFHRPPRREAGLPEAYIDRLAVYGHSKGRPPTLFLFNPACEAEIVHGLDDLPGPALRAQRDLEELPLALSVTEDAVLVRQTPSVAHLNQLRAAGLSIPEFIEWSGERLDGHPLTQRTLGRLEPWGWSPKSAALLAPLGGAAWDPAHAWRASKSFGVACARAVPAEEGLAPEWTLGQTCKTVAEVDEHIDAIRAQGVADVVMKAAWGAAGRGAIRQLNKQPRTRQQEGWLRRTLARQGQVVVEPWLPRVLDFSLHFDRDARGRIRFVGNGRFFTDARGQYRGHWMGRFTDGLSPDTIALLYGGGRDPRRWSRLARTVGQIVGERCGDYVGPLGVDAMVYRCPLDGALRIKPIVEVNPRWSMGRVALALGKRVRNGTPAAMRLIGPPDRKRLQITDLSRWAAQRPLMVDGDGRWISGALCITEPRPTRHMVAVVVVGETVDALA